MQKTQLIGLSNEIDAQGWCRICPYGESPKVTSTRDGQTNTYVQVMDKAGATALANGFNSLWGRLQRAVSSVPLFNGHPDLARIAPDQASRDSGSETPVGSINRLEARSDGLYAQVALFPSGQALATGGKNFISPFWWVTEFGTRGEIKMVRPAQLISGGLTDRPNISGGEALANESSRMMEAGSQNDELISMLRRFLQNHMVSVETPGSDEEVLGKIESLFGRLESEANSVRTGGEPIANEQSTSALGLICEDGKIRELRTAISNERSDYAGALVEMAICQGKISAKDRDEWIHRLIGSSDFSRDKVALHNSRDTTASVASGFEGRKGGTNFGLEERLQLNALCNERMEKDGVDFNAAWDAVIADPKNSALVYAMRSKH